MWTESLINIVNVELRRIRWAPDVFVGRLDGGLLRHDPTDMDAVRSVVHILARVFLLYASVVWLTVLMLVVELELLFGEVEL